MTTWTDVSPDTAGYQQPVRGTFYAGNRSPYAGELTYYAGYMGQITWTDISPDSTTWTDV